MEAALRQHPFVRDVGALARTSSADGSVTLVAYVCARNGAPAGLLDDLKAIDALGATANAARTLLSGRKIPRLASSKLDVRALMALDEINVQNERAHVVAAAEPIRRAAIASRVRWRKFGRKY